MGIPQKRITASEALGRRIIHEAGSDPEKLEQALDTGTEQVVPGDVTIDVRKDVLRLLGVIQVPRGRGDATLALNSQASCDATVAVASTVWERLYERQSLTLAEVREYTLPKSIEPQRVANLLKILELAVGRMGRDGGLDLPDRIPPPNNAESVPPCDETEEGEDYWYQYAETVLSPSVDFTVICGEQKKGGGDWGTPDVIGVYVIPSRSQLLPVRRVCAVEVKLAFTRAAIAQTTAYRRFAHYVYLAVPLTVPELDRETRAECGRLGIGIMCRKQSNSSALHLLSEAVFAPVDEELVDALLHRLHDDEKNPVDLRTLRLVRRAFHTTLAQED